MFTISRALLVGALLFFCIAPTPHATGQDLARATSIDELLELRSRAVIEKDRRAFLSTVDPSAERFREDQARIFDWMMALPLASYRLSVDLSLYGDLVRPSDEKRYPGAERVSVPLTIERYRLGGYDPDPVVRDHYFTFVRRDGAWFIASDSDLEDLGFFSARAPWELSEVQVERSPRFISVAGECAVCDSASSLFPLASQALEHVDDWWDQPWHKRVPVLIPSGSADLARMIEATYPVDDFVAFAFWTGADGEPPGARIVVNPQGFEGASADRISSILRHELFHVAALPSSGHFIPLWIEEGFAQYVQYGGSGAVIAASDRVSSGSLPDDIEFFSGTGAEILQVYRESLSATGFLVDRWGWGKAQRLYVKLGERGAVPGTARYHQDDVMKAVLGTTTARFEKLWASSIGA